MSEQIRLLTEIARRLDEAGFPYMLTGSMALSFYAQPRFTRDVDLVIELASQQAKRFVDLFSSDFECDEESVSEAIRHQKMFNLIHFETVLKFDFVVRKATAYRIEEFSRRRRFPLGASMVWVVAPEDLLLSKLLWGKDSRSALQQGDVRSLLQSGAPLDWAYVDRWAHELALERELAEVWP